MYFFQFQNIFRIFFQNTKKMFHISISSMFYSNTQTYIWFYLFCFFSPIYLYIQTYKHTLKTFSFFRQFTVRSDFFCCFSHLILIWPDFHFWFHAHNNFVLNMFSKYHSFENWDFFKFIIFFKWLLIRICWSREKRITFSNKNKKKSQSSINLIFFC